MTKLRQGRGRKQKTKGGLKERQKANAGREVQSRTRRRPSRLDPGHETDAVILDALDRKFMPVIGMTFLDLDAALCDGTLPVERQVALVQRFSPGAVRGAVATGQISLSDAANSATWSEYYQFRIQALCDEGVPVEVVLQHDLAQVTGRLCEAAVEAEREAERAEARDYQ